MQWTTQSLKLLNGHAVIVGHFYEQSMKDGCQKELKASGIDAEITESDAIIEDLIGKEDTTVDSGKDGKKKAEADKKAAEEIRTKAMERFGESSKRNGDEGEGTKKKKKEKWQRCSRVPPRKSKARPFSEGGRATAKERSTKPNIVVITAATADESSLPFPCAQNVIKREEITGCLSNLNCCCC